MTATLTIPTPGTPAGKTIAPNRYPPQPEGPAEEQRFAALLRQRREAQPPASPETRREANPEANPEAKPAAKPEAQPTAGSAARKPADGQTGGDADRAADDTTASNAPPVASTGCAAPKPRATDKPATRPATNWRDLPIIEVPMLPPNAAIDASTPADASTAQVDAADACSAPPATRSTEPAFWPGTPAATVDAATTVATGALAAGGGAAQEIRIGTGTPSAAPGSLPHADSATADAGQRGSGRNDGGGADAAADQAAALLDAAAANAETLANGHAGADRFVLPRALVPDSAPPGLSGNVAAHRTDASPAPAVALPTPLGAPDFAKALGAQVSLFARNGLAHAELQLTPAEMGPIRVQIAIDGAHARVDFAADSAATRQVIERGLPELASALREQGLTLSGGGVYQRAPDQQRDGGEAPHAVSGRARRRTTAAALEAGTVAQRPGTRSARPGGVDLYA